MLRDSVFKVQPFNHTEYEHVRQVYLHTYTAKVSYHAVVKHHIGRTHGINKPQGEQCQFGSISHYTTGNLFPKSKVSDCYDDR